jgi:hypothetical protein
VCGCVPWGTEACVGGFGCACGGLLVFGCVDCALPLNAAKLTIETIAASVTPSWNLFFTGYLHSASTYKNGQHNYIC